MWGSSLILCSAIWSRSELYGEGVGVMFRDFVASLADRLHGLTKAKGVKGDLVRGGAGSVAIKIASTFLGLLTAVFVARVLGPEQYGVYAYVMALVSLFSIPAAFGLPQLVVRETAKAYSHEQWGLMRGIWGWSTRIVGGLTVVMGVTALVVSLFMAERFSAAQLQTMYWGVLLIPFMTLGGLRGAALRGLKKVNQGQVPDALVRPLVFLVLIAMLGLLHVELSAPSAMAMSVMSAALAFGVGAWLLWKSCPMGIRQKPVAVINGKAWLKSAMPLALTSALFMVNQNTDIVMIGWYGTASDVGIYRVSVVGGGLVVFALSSMNMVIGPYYAQFYAKKELAQLQKLATQSARAILLMTLPVVLVFLLFGKSLITMVYGPQFIAAYAPLVVISIGQLMSAGFGSVGLILNMTGHEMETTKGIAVAALTNVLLNMLLIPWYGITGAAVATTVTLFAWNFLLWLAVARNVGVDTLAVPVAEKLGIGKKWGKY